MNRSVKSMWDELAADAQPPQPIDEEPDFTGWTHNWTHKEIADRRMARIARMAHTDFVALVRAANASPPSQEPPTPPEQYAAWDARDAAILAERLAEEAKRRPPPEANPDAPGPAAAAVRPSPEPEPPASHPEPEPPPEPKQWWEERAHWRKRSRAEEEDARRGRPLYRCLVEYDPIAWFRAEQEEEDYDPLE
jgi:hypothetical protein